MEESATAGVLPDGFRLSQNYPNPFNPSTAIRFQVPERGRVTLRVFDVVGNEISTILDQEMPAGSHSVRFDASGLASGVYFYRLQSGACAETKSMHLIK